MASGGDCKFSLFAVFQPWPDVENLLTKFPQLPFHIGLGGPHWSWGAPSPGPCEFLSLLGSGLGRGRGRGACFLTPSERFGQAPPTTSFCRTAPVGERSLSVHPGISRTWRSGKEILWNVLGTEGESRDKKMTAHASLGFEQSPWHRSHQNSACWCLLTWAGSGDKAARQISVRGSSSQTLSSTVPRVLETGHCMRKSGGHPCWLLRGPGWG